MSNPVRIQLVSDLHSEVHDRYGAGLPSWMTSETFRTDADLVLLAGDTGSGGDGVRLASDLLPQARHLVVVGGNHEHYHGTCDIDETLDGMRTVANALSTPKQTIHVLENETALLAIGNTVVRIIGTTLWTDFGLFGDQRAGAMCAEYRMNDYRVIKGGPRYDYLTVEETFERNQVARWYIERELSLPHDGPTVVLTHHAPSLKSLPAQLRHNAEQDRPHAVAYASAFDGMLKLGATLWVHGHIHKSANYKPRGGTRVLANPAGRPDRHSRNRFGIDNGAFRPRLTVELGQDSDGRWTVTPKRSRR